MSSATEPKSESRCDVLILGASFAGVEVVYQLLRLSGGKPPSIVVVDRQRSHGYLPLVQERLCARIEPEQTMLETRAYVESVPRAEYLEDEIETFDPETRTATLASGKTVRGRTVVVALGSVVEPPSSLVGPDLLVPYKDSQQFAAARERLRETLADADETPGITVVGGGISGVELAGELADLGRKRPEEWSAPQVTLVSSGETLVPGLGPRVSRRVETALREQGVDVRLGARVRGAEAGRVQVREGDETVEIPASLALWAAGIRPAPILEAFGLPRTDDGWLRVGPTLQCFATPTPSHPEVFACGDAVRIVSGDGQWPTMQRAIEAIWQAKTVAVNVLALLAEREGYPDGVPPLRPHRLRETFVYGVSVGAKSYVAYRGFLLDLPGFNHWFRRWLMRQYFARYRPLPGAEKAQLPERSEANR